MLYAFGVKNYRNLNMDKPLILPDGISYIYGTCSSGKTNFCKALVNILDPIPDPITKKESTFFYHFYISEYDFIYKYLTDSSGIVKTAAVQIPQFNFTYKYTAPLRHPLDIFTACRTFTAEASIHNIFSMFRHDLLNNFQSFIPEYESEIQTYSSEYSLGKSGINTHLLKNPPSETKRLILIIDDFEYNGMLPPTHLADAILSRHDQAIFTVRRSDWLDKKYGNPEHYFFIRNGNIRQFQDYVQKDIRSTEQLKNLFIKGMFDF